MGISDWFRFRSRRAHTDDLRYQLFDTLDREDYTAAMHLINGNADRIRSEFPSWTTVPSLFRGNADLVNRYMHNLSTIAMVFEKSGDSSLRVSLEGGSDNPFTRRTESLGRARLLTEAGQAADAVVLLRTTLDEIAITMGTGSSQYRAMCLGSLGAALDKLGDTSEAVRATREALEICRQSGDEEGVHAYTQNLDVIGSWEITEPEGGDSFKVIFRDSEGGTLLPEELPGRTGRFTWEIRHGEPALPRPSACTKKDARPGRRGSGRRDRALHESGAD